MLASLRLVLLVWTQSNRPIYIYIYRKSNISLVSMNFSMKNCTHSACLRLLLACAPFLCVFFFVFVLLRSNSPYHFILSLNCAVYLYCAYILITHNIALLFFSHACTVNPLVLFPVYNLNERNEQKKPNNKLFSGQYVLVNYLHILIFGMLTAKKSNKIAWKSKRLKDTLKISVAA